MWMAVEHNQCLAPKLRPHDHPRVTQHIGYRCLAPKPRLSHCGSNFLVNAIVHEKPLVELSKSWHNCPWQYFWSFNRGIIILFIFTAPRCVFTPASQDTSHIRNCWHIFSGGPWLQFTNTNIRGSDQICPFSFEDVLLACGLRPHYF